MNMTTNEKRKKGRPSKVDVIQYMRDHEETRGMQLQELADLLEVHISTVKEKLRIARESGIIARVVTSRWEFLDLVPRDL